MTVKTQEEELVVSLSQAAAVGNGAAVDLAKAQDREFAKVIEAWTQKVDSATAKYRAELTRLEEQKAKANGAAPLYAQIVGLTSANYMWWNLLVVGPFQWETNPMYAGAPKWRPTKVLKAGLPTRMICQLWRNPVASASNAFPAPSLQMAPYHYTVRGEMINLSTVADGPTVAVATNVQFGAGNINNHVFDLPALPVPPQGAPHLYEINFTVDILETIGTGPDLAGFATWIYDPDTEPAFGPLSITLPDGTVIAGIVPGGSAVQHDIPVRFMVHS